MLHFLEARVGAIDVTHNRAAESNRHALRAAEYRLQWDSPHRHGWIRNKLFNVVDAMARTTVILNHCHEVYLGAREVRDSAMALLPRCGSEAWDSPPVLEAARSRGRVRLAQQ